MITTILTGAGAVLDWGAPSTSYLTEVLRENETFKTKSGIPVGEYLFSLLKEKNTGEINFEHIINLVEAIYNYVDTKENKLHTAETIFSFIDKEIESELFSFCDIYEEGKYGFFYPIVGDVEKCFNSKHQYMNKIYNHFIKLILEKIEPYEQTFKEHGDLNNSFNDFLASFNDNNTIRFYTTNYDRIPAKIKPNYFFEGFGRELEIKQKHTFFDTEKVTSEINQPCYYNLHGSIHYNYGGAGWLLNPEKVFYQLELSQKEINQLGEIHLPSNIITGMGKASRILFGPHLSFYNSFYNDCMRTDNLIIIGYSFSDIHINQAIRNAIVSKRNPKNLKVIIVDYLFSDCCNETDEKFQEFSDKIDKHVNINFPKFDGISNCGLTKSTDNPNYCLYSFGVSRFLDSEICRTLFK
jgi:hypothetical protein